MPQPSTIKNHARRDDIERAIAEGVPAVEIARRFGVSPSAVARFKSNRFDALSAVLDDTTPAPDAILARLRDIADSARITRQLADASSSPTVRAKALSTELSALTTLWDKAGISDMSSVAHSEATGALVRALRTFTRSHPDSVPDILAALAEHPQLEDLADALRADRKK